MEQVKSLIWPSAAKYARVKKSREKLRHFRLRSIRVLQIVNNLHCMAKEIVFLM